MNELVTKEAGGEFLLYKAEDGLIRIETRMQEETVWLTQDQMAQLFGKAKSTINEHIKNIFKEGELIEEQVMRKFGNSEFSTKTGHPRGCYCEEIRSFRKTGCGRGISARKLRTQNRGL